MSVLTRWVLARAKSAVVGYFSPLLYVFQRQKLVISGDVGNGMKHSQVLPEINRNSLYVATDEVTAKYCLYTERFLDKYNIKTLDQKILREYLETQDMLLKHRFFLSEGLRVPDEIRKRAYELVLAEKKCRLERCSKLVNNW